MGSSYMKYPLPSTVNVANFVTVRPWLWEQDRSSKFNIWKEQMICLLESQDLLGFINGEIPPPEKADTAEEMSSSTAETEQKIWRRTDRLVKGWILGSIGNDALDAVWNLETARDVWLELEKIFSDDEESESQSDDDIAHDEEDGIGAEVGEIEDFKRYLPLYKAAQRGDWETAKNFFDNDREAATAIINSELETALHVAVLARKNNFVKKLVELTPHDALAQQDGFGDTALHNAALIGNTEAAMTLVNKNEDLLYILNNNNALPVVTAAIYCQKGTLQYLMSVSKPNVQPSPFEGPSGIAFLVELIYSEFFDVALDLLKKYPELARLRNIDGDSALTNIAGMSFVFPSGETFSWWQNLIYHCTPIKRSKGKAARATSIAGDIENISCNAPTYNKCFGSFRIIGAQKLESMIWKIIQYLVPQVKSIRDKKTMHQQALQLVKCLCKNTASLPENEASIMFADSIIMATKHGINEIVEEIIEMYPRAISACDGETGRSVFLLAACNRFENIFNLVYKLSHRKYQLSNVDDDRNNLMHMCAKLAPPDRLNLVPGAALQMQRELQWFKEMEKFVRPGRQTWENNDKQTPKMLFTEEHQQLKADGERWMKDTANACTIAAALTATVVFAAAFTVPGGNATDTGVPIFSNHFSFIVFAMADAISLFASVTSLLMFLSILTSRYAEEDFLYVLPKRLAIGLLSLFLSITFMMVAFSATLYLVFRRKVAWSLVPVASFACLPITSFVLLQFPLLVDVIYGTYGPGIFGKKSDLVLF